MELNIRGKLTIILTLFLMLGFSSQAWSQADDTETKKAKTLKSKVKSATKGKKLRKKIGVDQSDFMPSANQFGFITSYIVSYDDLQQEDEKSYNHRLGFAGTYSFSKALSSYAAMSILHQTKNEKIVRENDTDRYHGVSNLNLGAVYSYSPESKRLSRSSTTFNLALPFSERSQVDQHIAEFSLANFLVTPSWNKLSLYSRVTADFLWQQLRFSIFSNDRLNRDWYLAGVVGVNYQVIRNVGIRVSVVTDNTRYLDGSWENSFGNRLSIFSNIYGFQVFGSMSNNSYPENDRLDVAFFDRYRRIFTFGVTHAF